MNIFNSYKRSRFFLWVNITGLSIGLAASIMLILFVVNELSYDRHFANSERIVRLITELEIGGEKNSIAITLRKAYTEIPGKVPGVEAATQVYNQGENELIRESERFQKLKYMVADPAFFRVFQMKFLEGTPEKALEDRTSLVITRKYADIIFGGAAEAIGKTVSVKDRAYTVSAVVEELPENTHFSFDIMSNLGMLYDNSGMNGLEFLTYFLLGSESSSGDVRSAIEKEYTAILEPFTAQFNARGRGITEKLTDIYLHSNAQYSRGKSNDMKFVWLLTLIAVFILILAIVNFVNLFMAQCETRMNEIAIRKTNGAGVANIIRQFFAEVSQIVLFAFCAGFFLAMVATPYFSQLIHRDIDMQQMLNPQFILCAALLFVLTVTLSATYPSFYMSRFSPLDILARRLRFSRRRLTTILIVFQSVVTVVLISCILVINRQTDYLKNLPLNYDTDNIMLLPGNRTMAKSYAAVCRELSNTPGIQAASATDHIIGGGWSGQGIALFEDRENAQLINEYRVLPGVCEMMNFRLLEGGFFRNDAPDSVQKIIVNEAALKMLGLQMPLAGKQVYYKESTAEIIGVVKDFIYKHPAEAIEPLVLSGINAYPDYFYIKFDKNLSRLQAQELAADVLHQFDSEFILNPMWSDDVHSSKFDSFNTQFKVVLAGSLMSMFIAMTGLLATHLYTARRRRKEIGIRRINGAAVGTVLALLSWDIVKWICAAGVIAIPVAWYIADSWLNSFGSHTSPGALFFIIPLLLQCLTAFVTTLGVTLKVALQNPVAALKTE